MKTKLFTFGILCFLATTLFAQKRDTLTTKPNGGLKQASRMQKTDAPKFRIQDTTFTIHDCIIVPNGSYPPEEAEQGYSPNGEINSPSNCQSIFTYNSFEANNLAGGTPADNYMAISNNGKIISVDNYSIIEYTASGIEISNTQ